MKDSETVSSPVAHILMREVPYQIRGLEKRWRFQAACSRILHATLSFGAIASSLLIALKINEWDKTKIEWLSFATAFSVSLLSGFELGAKANRLRRAWRKLNAAIIRFENEPEFSIEQLVKIYEQAEEIIGDVKEHPHDTK